MARTVEVTGAVSAPPTTARRSLATRGSDAPARPARTTSTRDRAQAAPSRSSGSTRAAGRGFSSWKSRVKEGKDFSTFQVPADQVKVIAFMEAENYDIVFRHWVPTVTDDGRTVKVPRNCIFDDDNGVSCPLCEVGDEPKPVALWNIIDLDEPDKVQLWEAGKEVMKRIEKLWAQLQEIPEDRGGPLDLNSPGEYAAVSREKKTNGFWEYTILRVKERDLGDDHGLDPLTDAQIEAALENLNTSEDIKFNTPAELRELADSLAD